MVWRDKVKRLMRAKGITQESLIPILGVTTRGAVGHYLSGRRQLSVEQFYALTKFLGTRVEEVFEESPYDTFREEPALYTHDTLRLARAIESLPPESRAILKKVADSFAKSAPWDGEVERRRGGKA